MTDQNDTTLATVPQGQNYLSPAMNLKAAVAIYNEMKAFVSQILVEDVDFGKVPGSSKPSLLKPGAEKLTRFFGLSIRIPVELRRVEEDWTGERHGGMAFFNYSYTAQAWRGDMLVAECEGSCNSFEKKYRYRWISEMEIPSMVDKSNLEYQDGAISEFAFAVEKAETSGKYGKPAEYWQRFKDAIANGTAKEITRKTKKGEDMKAWEIGGKVYAVPNHDPADQVNTLQKMAQKRAIVGVALLACNASEYFTQDVEDFTEGQFMEIPVNGIGKVSREETVELSLENAKRVTTSDGMFYADLTDEHLEKIVDKANSELKKSHTPDQALDLKYKLSAATTILESRKQ